MRLAVASAAVALAACGALYDVDSTSPDAPRGSGTDGRLPSDGTGRDAPAPAPGSGSAGSDTCRFLDDPTKLAGSSGDAYYAVTADGSAAVWSVADGRIMTGDPAGAFNTLEGSNAFSTPRLEPGGTLFIAAQPSHLFELKVINGDQATEMLGLDGTPSTPTMNDLDIIMDQGGGVLREYTRPSATATWIAGDSITSVTGAREPSLSADGLRVVFAGDASGLEAIYTATRAQIGDRFGTSHVAYTTMVFTTPTTPFIKGTCAQLTFSAAGALYSVPGVTL